MSDKLFDSAYRLLKDSIGFDADIPIIILSTYPKFDEAVRALFPEEQVKFARHCAGFSFRNKWRMDNNFLGRIMPESWLHADIYLDRIIGQRSARRWSLMIKPVVWDRFFILTTFPVTELMAVTDYGLMTNYTIHEKGDYDGHE